MALPSIHQLLQQTAVVVKRFPVPMLVCLLGSVCAFALTLDGMAQMQQWMWGKLLLLCFLALPFSIAITVVAKYNLLPIGVHAVLYTCMLVVLAGFYVSMPEGEPGRKEMLRFAMLNTTAHLLVACAPFLGKRLSAHAFWQYNRILFLRIITSGIFSGVLFLGLAGALAALKELFHLRLGDDWFMRIFILIAGWFNTSFFLFGIPDEAEALETDDSYPKVLSVFTRFVLLPLVFIYFAILLAYELKITLQWELPTGWVSNLIIAFAIAGILSILLVYPIRNTANNKWVRVFSKWFYLLMLPLVVLMLVAIFKRISDYGFTEERLIVLITACWLTIITILFILRPEGDIRVIPLSLAILAFAAQLSIFNISMLSQQKRLKQALQSNSLLKDGKAQILKGSSRLSNEEADNIESITRYLLNMHGINSIAPILRNKLPEGTGDNDWAMTRKLMDSLGYTKASVYDDGYVVSLHSNQQAIPIAGFSELVPIGSEYNEEIKATQAWLNEANLVVDWANQSKQLFIPIDSLIAPIFEKENRYSGYRELAPNELRFSYASGEDSFVIQFQNISADKKSGSWQIVRSQGFVLVK